MSNELAAAIAEHERNGRKAMTLADWKKLHRDFKGFNESTGQPYALHNCGSAGTQSWPVVILNEDGTVATRQPKGRVCK